MRPGLDFTDKTSGYDFYPQQTIQPFAIMDSLLRLGLARVESLDVTTLDLSSRVNDHLDRARRRAREGKGYVIQLPRPLSRQWKEATVAYWQRFGDQIGSPAATAAVPAGAGDVRMRAIRVAS